MSSLKIRIKKQTYRFFIRNAYIYKKRFRKIKDYVKSPFEKIKESLGEVTLSTIISSGYFQGILALIGLFLIITGIAIMFTSHPNPVMPGPEYTLSQWLSPEIKSSNITFMSMVSYGEGKNAIAIIPNKDYTIHVYNSLAPSVVYYLDYKAYPPKYMNGVDVYKSILERKLKDEGIELKVVGIDDLKRLDKDSVVIVPTGMVPIEFSSGINHTIIFIGQDVTKYYNQKTGTVNTNLKPLVSKVSERAPSVGLKLKMSEFLVGEGKQVHGIVSVAQLKGGTLVTIPASLQSWDSVEDAVDDTIKIIDEHPWTEEIGSADVPSNTLSFSPSFKQSSVYVVVKDNDTIVYSGKVVSQNYDSVNLDMNEIIPLGISKDESEIYFSIHINKPYNYLYDSYKYYVYDSSNRKINTQSDEISLAGEDTQFTIPNDLHPGNYLLKLVRFTNGKQIVTAVHGFHVVAPVMNVEAIPETNTYNIRVLCDRDCDNFKYSTATLYVDGEQEKVFDYANYLTTTLYLSGGEHTLTLDFGKGLKTSYTVNIKKKTFLDYLFNPLYFGIIILSIFIVALAIQFRRKEKDVYYLDIPDFPPVSRITVPMKRSVILSLFDQIEKDYGWHYLPIKISELQSALLRLSYKGRPLNVSEHNIEKVLDLLSSEGYVKSYDGYYALTKWCDETGKDIKTFALLRKLRDMFINNVVRFEPFGKVKNADTKIYLSGDEYYILLFNDPTDVILKTIGPLKDKNVIILFENELAKENFVNMLYSHDKEVLMFKLELNSDNITLMTLDEFEKFLKKFKKI